MYKALSAFLLFVVLLAGSVFLLLFTNTGNSFLRPYINSYIVKNYDIDLKLVSFTLRPNFLDVEAYLYKNIRVVLNGDIDIWKKSFSLDFTVNAKDVKTKYIKTGANADIKGKLTGDIKHIKVNGEGKVLNSSVKFDTAIDNYKAKNLHLYMKKARIAQLLTLLNKPPYISGIIDIDLNFDDLNPDDLQGNADINIPYGSVNTVLVKKDFNITLPTGFIFQAKDKTLLRGKETLSSVNFKSNIFKLNSTKTVYNIKAQTFDSDYSLIIPNLKLLRSVTRQNLQGSFKAEGRVKKEGKDISYLISTFSLGGNLKAVGYNDKIEINAQELRLDKILYMLSLPKYSYADIELHSYLDHLGSKEMGGDINATISKGTLNKALFQKDFNISLPDDFSYRVSYNAAIKENIMNFQTDINSSVVTLLVNDANMDLNNLNTKGKYSANIQDLSSLYFLTKQRLSGNAKFDGNFNFYEGIFVADGKTDIFDTNTTYQYKNGDIKVSALDISVLKLSDTFGYPRFFDAKGKADLFYNPKYKRGNFKVILNDGKIIRNELSDTVFMLSGFDITKELYANSLLQGTINGDMVKFVYDMNSSNTLFKIYSATVDTKQQLINAPFILKIKDKDIQGEIKGDIHHPKVKINTSSYIKNRLEKVIDKKVPKKFQEPLKQILNLFGR
jgi:hypothetical protein